MDIVAEDLNDEWDNYCNASPANADTVAAASALTFDVSPPDPTPLRISTRTLIAFLNQPIAIYDFFWKLNLLPYHIPQDGILKKQIKFNSKSPHELEELQGKIHQYCSEHSVFLNETIKRHIEPTSNMRIKFSDVRKISMGLCTKDFIERPKNTGAFNNCIAIILRVSIPVGPLRDINDPPTDLFFREFHVKLFNTGKLEMLGVITDEMYQLVVDTLIRHLSPYFEQPLSIIPNSCQTILIHSYFRCGYYLNRDNLYDLLRRKYNIDTNFDSCSYQAINCKFYYDPTTNTFTGRPVNSIYIPKQPTTVSSPSPSPFNRAIPAMIFRTGYVLIMSGCSQDLLNMFYQYLCSIFKDEFSYIALPNGIKMAETDRTNPAHDLAKSVRKRPKKKYIYITDAMFSSNEISKHSALYGT